MKLYPYQQAIIDRLLNSNQPMIVQFARRFGVATMRAELERTAREHPGLFKPLEIRPLSSFRKSGGLAPTLVVMDEIIGGNRAVASPQKGCNNVLPRQLRGRRAKRRNHRKG